MSSNVRSLKVFIVGRVGVGGLVRYLRFSFRGFLFFRF